MTHSPTADTQHTGSVVELAAQLSQIVDLTTHSPLAQSLTAWQARFAQLTEMEARFRAFLRSSQDAVLLADPKGGVQEWNEGAERLFGLTAGELRGKQVEELLEVPTLEEQPDHQITTIRMQGIHTDGSRFPADVSLASSPTPEGTVYTFMIRDVTGEELLKAQLLQSQKLEAIGALAAGVAHEINTPTQYVNDNMHFLQTSFTELQPLFLAVRDVLNSTDADGATKQSLDALRYAAEAVDLEFLLSEIPLALTQSAEGLHRIAEIVRSMKALSHPGSRQQEFRSENLNDLIQQAVTVSTGEWKYVATVETEFDPGLPPVECRHGEITQVVLNLLVNAAHAIDAARAEPQAPKGTIRIRTEQRGERAIIRISDTGIGMPPDVRARIFDPFFTTKEVGKGTGQGLAIAWSAIVEKHRGELTCESQPGLGTTFAITLPLRQEGLQT